MSSEFLRYAKNRAVLPDAENIVLGLKEIAAPWDRKADDLSDEEAYKILLGKKWINLQGTMRPKAKAIRDITPLADFRELTGVCLWDNAIESIAPLRNLTKLVRCGLRKNQVKDLTPLEKMVQLEELEIHSNPIRDLSVLAHLPALKELEMDSDQIAGFAGVHELASLWDLRIHGGCVDLRGLPELPNLRCLQLEDCQSLSGIERFTELRNLHVGTGQVSDLTPIAGLKKLTHLNFGHNRVESLEPLRRLFALRDIWAGHNRIASVEPLRGLPVLHVVNLVENPVSLQEVLRLQAELTSWDEEFADPNPKVEPALQLETVDQETWDYYDTHPFNAADLDGDDDLRSSEKSWLIEQLENALELDWTKEEDFVVPWTGNNGRSNTVMLCSQEAAGSLRAIASTIQQILCKMRNEFIIYLQTDLLGEGDYIVWVYRDRILVAPPHEAVVTDLLSQ